MKREAKIRAKNYTRTWYVKMKRAAIFKAQNYTREKVNAPHP